MQRSTIRHRRPSPFLRGLVVAAVALITAPLTLSAQAASPAPERWQAKEPPLTTPWTQEVGPDNALPEYPRPQMKRQEWRNLNGQWEYEAATSEQPPSGRTLQERILVPYPPESALSGIQRHDDVMDYRHTFEVPQRWDSQRLILHFGAVDQIATVLVNGQEVASHSGGFTAFSADITDALRGSGPQELVVRVEDRNDANPYPVGKQRNEPGGIFYTGASGIWQTVWMEPAPESHLRDLNITPDLESDSFHFSPEVAAPEAHQVDVTVSEPGGAEVGKASAAAGDALSVHVPEPRLWNPQDPFLYDVTAKVLDPDGNTVDEVTSYAGMRSTSIVRDEQGRARIALNGEILYQHGPLDQGYWPDGIYTAPTDEALRFDLAETKKLGFNMVRKHVKVEPARWYHWADRLGLLVWQDMPSLKNATTPSPEAQANFEAELEAMVDQLGDFPSIVTWVPFNEGWGEYDTARIAKKVKAQDPTRLVDANSGVNCCESLPDSGAGDIYDDHTYVGPGAPPVEGERASVVGEYGGLGLVADGHLWPGEPEAYEMAETPAQLTQRYNEVNQDVVDVIHRNGLSASVYTQTTDVENEVNGFFTYDRRVLKPNAETVRQRNQEIIEAGTP